ncbi:MAG: acetoacetate decarboxylase family protein [Venatoribacter sp.]
MTAAEKNINLYDYITPAKERPNLSGFFKAISQVEIPMVDFHVMGRLPVFYYDNTAMTAAFMASSKEVRKLLPDPDMHLIEVVPGRCVVTVSAFEYRDSDIDPYNELSIGFLISHGKKRLPALPLLQGLVQNDYSVYVWQLPVTTEIARWGGVELYGFPKFIADINFDRTAKRTKCTLSHDGQHILTLDAKNLSTSRKEKPLRFRAFSMLEGNPMCANIYTNPKEYGQSLMPNSAKLTLGNHPIAQTLKTLKLSSFPLMLQYCPTNEMSLFGPRNLMDN